MPELKTLGPGFSGGAQSPLLSRKESDEDDENYSDRERSPPRLVKQFSENSGVGLEDIESDSELEDLVSFAGHDLDIFFQKVYSYYTERGITCIIASRLANLM